MQRKASRSEVCAAVTVAEHQPRQIAPMARNFVFIGVAPTSIVRTRKLGNRTRLYHNLPNSAERPA